MDKSILAPAAVLVLWSLIMMVWMAATRLPAMKKVGIDLGTAVGGRGVDIDPNVPQSVAWKSHNYAHLMEQPTIFYATVLILAVAGAVTPFMVSLAWSYTILRVLHSLWQATINKVSIRFVLFLLSSICLVVMAVHAVIATI
jgi:hypothetical protein